MILPPPGTLEAFGLFLVRTSALVLASPLLGTGSTFSGYKLGLIGILGALLYTLAGFPTVPADMGVLAMGMMGLRELLIGLVLAFSVHTAALAVRVGSELIGHEMVFNMANVVDPASGMRVPLIAHFYELFFFLALLSVDGHHWLVRALVESYERAPVAQLSLSDELPHVVLTQFVQMFAAGLTLAAPILVLLMMVSLVLGLLTRAVPQINVLEFGFSLRISGGLVAMFLFAPMLGPALSRLLSKLMDGLNQTLDALVV
ncbi:MAG: flagellar biosynthetic protein FliR [Planctomycetota bacterium]|nr:flagellar biosynthetic protein FliR [Planctomycetota bacterium]